MSARAWAAATCSAASRRASAIATSASCRARAIASSARACAPAVRPSPLGAAHVRRRAGLGRLRCRPRLGGGGAGPVRELFRLAGAGHERRPVQIELGRPLGQRQLGRLGVGGQLLGGVVGVRAQPDGVVALPLGRELGPAGAGGVLLGLRDGRAGPAGDGRELQVERGRVGQRRQLLAEPLVQLALGPQVLRGGRVLASCLLKQVTGTLLGGRENQFIPNGPG